MVALVGGAGMIATGLFAWIIFIAWRGGWSPAVEAARVELLARAALAMAGLMGASMIGLLLAGPLARIKATIAGNEIDVEGDDG